MAEVVSIPVARLRRSRYNPRIVQDSVKATALRESVRREGVRQPHLVWYNREEDIYEVLDGGRRLRIAKELGMEELPCIILDVEKNTLGRTSLSIHITQDDLSPEEIVNFIDRMIAEGEFQTVEEVCRYYGLSKQWYYELRKAMKIRGELYEEAKEIPVSTLALIERAEIPREKKEELVEKLRETPLPREAVKQVVERLESNPQLSPREEVEKQVEMEPRHVDEGYLEAEGEQVYKLKKIGEVVSFTALKKDNQEIATIPIPKNDLPIVKRLFKEI